MSNLVDIPASRVRKSYPYVVLCFIGASKSPCDLVVIWTGKIAISFFGGPNLFAEIWTQNDLFHYSFSGISSLPTSCLQSSLIKPCSSRSYRPLNADNASPFPCTPRHICGYSHANLYFINGFILSWKWCVWQVWWKFAHRFILYHVHKIKVRLTEECMLTLTEGTKKYYYDIPFIMCCTGITRTLKKSERALPRVYHYDSYFIRDDLWPPGLKMLRYISLTILHPVSTKFIGPSDRQDKYVISPICLISSRTEMSDVASNTMYTMYTQSQTDISSVLWNDSPNRNKCPMKFHKVSRTLCIYVWNMKAVRWKLLK